MTTHSPSFLARIMQWTTGQWLALIACIHTLFGIVAGITGLSGGEAAGRSPLAEIWSMGVFASIEPDLLRALWFWFTWFGFAIFLAAYALHKIERLQGHLGRNTLLGLLALGVSGVFMIPASGFWFVVLLAAVKLWRGAPAHTTREPVLTSH